MHTDRNKINAGTKHHMYTDITRAHTIDHCDSSKGTRKKTLDQTQAKVHIVWEGSQWDSGHTQLRTLPEQVHIVRACGPNLNVQGDEHM